MHKFTLGLLLFSLAFALGCGSDVGKVSGTVTLDGAPVEDALVTFEPDGGGRLSYGRTDASGAYSLTYTENEQGAEIGKHRVIIQTQQDGDPDQGIERRPETLPAKYNSQSELTAEVTSGKQTINFELKSEGEVVQEVSQ